MPDLAPAAVDTVQIGSLIAGRYKVEKLLGRGGFGAVYRVRHATTGQAQVLKILRPNLADDPTQVQRFFNEAKVSARLSHPNTVHVFDFGQTDTGLLYIAMELLDGHELAHAIREKGVLEPMRTVHIALAVLKSLAEAHAAGLVHRDLKPDNVFLCKHAGEADFVKVIDFGIAKAMDAATDSGLTRTGFTVGTPKYMSPEQVLNKPLDGRSDLYALGVMLYQCLSGDVPLAGPSPMETLMMHLQQEPRPLEEVAPQALPAGLAAVVMQALCKQPGERFADAEDMRAALEEVLAKAGQGTVPLHKRAMSAKLRAVTTEDLDGATTPHKGPRSGAERMPTGQTLQQKRPEIPPIPSVKIHKPAPATVAPGPEPTPRSGDLPQTAVLEARVAEPLLTVPRSQLPWPWLAGAVGVAALAAIALYLTARQEPQAGTQVPESLARVAAAQAPAMQAMAAPSAIAPALPAPPAPSAVGSAAMAPAALQVPSAADPAAEQVAAPVPTKPTDLQMLSGLDRARAEAAVHGAIASCLRGQPGGAAIVLTVTVDVAGVVQGVKLAPSDRSDSVQACVIEAVKAVPFSAGPGPRAGILAFAGEVAPVRKVATPARSRANPADRRASVNGDENL